MKKFEMIFEKSARWVRVEFNNFFIADSKNVNLLIESPMEINYYFPLDDVILSKLEKSDYFELNRNRGKRIYWNIRVDDKLAKNAAWSYESVEGRPNLSNYIAFKWDMMDHWYEEDEEVFYHAKDPYHRVDYIYSNRHIEVFIDEQKVGDSKRPVLVFETGLPVRYYLPIEDVNTENFTPSNYISFCPYKGKASYSSYDNMKNPLKDIIWYYLEPKDEAVRLKGTVAFWSQKDPDRIKIKVDGEFI